MNYCFFWGGIYSNWNKSTIKINSIVLKDSLRIELNSLGREFNCAEQAMMFFKALLFEDYESCEKIIKSKNPREQKKLGRKVKNFKPEIWDLAKFEIVKNINFHKFNQNESLKKQLLEEDCDLFVEASPFDRIWGIGYSEEDALNFKSNWGENLLGKALTEIRNEFLSSSKN